MRYHDLLVDWTAPLFRLGELFDLSAVKSATDDDIRQVHDFIDPNLRRAQLTWDDVRVPPRLREVAEDSWRALNKLAEPEGDVPETHAYLDEVRAAYTALYEESEAITQSTIVAARRKRRPAKFKPRPGAQDTVALPGETPSRHGSRGGPRFATSARSTRRAQDARPGRLKGRARHVTSSCARRN